MYKICNPELGAKCMGGIMKAMEKDADNHGSDKMVSRCELELRYRAVDIRDLNWNKKKSGNQA